MNTTELLLKLVDIIEELRPYDGDHDEIHPEELCPNYGNDKAPCVCGANKKRESADAAVAMVKAFLSETQS